MSIVLQQRDLDVLENVFKYRVVTYLQIHQRFFSTCHKVTAYQRIVELCKAGFLKPYSLVMNGKMQKYVEITSLGLGKIRHFFGYTIDHPLFRSESPVHDLRFSDVSTRFEKLKSFSDFLTENLMQSSTELLESERFSDLVKTQADAALLLNGPDGKNYLYAVEYELSKKNPERYKDKLTAYYTNNQIQSLLYICSDQQIINSLARVNEEVRNNRKSILYMALENDVLNSKDLIHFYGTKDEVIELF